MSKRVGQTELVSNNAPRPLSPSPRRRESLLLRGLATILLALTIAVGILGYFSGSPYLWLPLGILAAALVIRSVRIQVPTAQEIKDHGHEQWPPVAPEGK